MADPLVVTPRAYITTYHDTPVDPLTGGRHLSRHKLSHPFSGLQRDCTRSQWAYQSYQRGDKARRLTDKTDKARKGVRTLPYQTAKPTGISYNHAGGPRMGPRVCVW